MWVRPSPVALLVVAFAASGCRSDDEPGEGGPATVVPGGGAPVFAPFRASSLLEIPAAAMDGSWMLRDLDGDRRPDIVVTAGKDLRVFGFPDAPHWRFARNGGDGFADPVAWRVPAGGHPDAGFNWRNPPQYAGLEPPYEVWYLVDLTGDRRPELVVTGVQESLGFRALGPPGARVLRVHPNRGGGFGDGVDWPLPPATDPEPEGVAFTPYPALQGRNPLRLLDLDGDGLRDLVVTGERVAGDLHAPGVPNAPHWRFFRNDGAAFGGEEAWSLPLDSPAGSDVTATDVCGTAGPCWWLRDLDGDRRPDLVLSSVDGASVLGGGSPAWIVYPNTGHGFGEGRSWAVPAPAAPTAGFFWLNPRQLEPPQTCVTDLDGDDVPELVQSTRPDSFEVPGAPARPHWLVFANDGDGFSSSAVEWLVPAEATGRESLGPVTPADAREQLWGAEAVALWDMDGDGRRDLLVHGRDLDDSLQLGHPDAGHFTVYWSRP